MSARWTETGARDWDAERSEASMPTTTAAASRPFAAFVLLLLVGTPLYLLGHVWAVIV